MVIPAAKRVLVILLTMLGGATVGTALAYVVSLGVWTLISSQKLVVQNLFREISILDSIAFIILLALGCIEGIATAIMFLLLHKHTRVS